MSHMRKYQIVVTNFEINFAIRFLSFFSILPNVRAELTPVYTLTDVKNALQVFNMNKHVNLIFYIIPYL